jgi:DNA primase
MAGQIPSQFIDELLSRIDVVDIVDARVPLKKSGKNLSACCPFHNEKTPSFTVSREKQFYHCFGCGAHGSAISFLMEYDQLSFPESIHELADSVGMKVPTTHSAAPVQNQQSLYDLLGKVSQYYVHQLQNHAQKGDFNQYIQQRGLSTEIVERFQIGMAPDGWDNVLRTFGGDPASQAQLDKTGMLSHNDSGKTYDRFRNRLMFPIHDRRGRIVGFGGRVLDDSLEGGGPKYLNSPETPIFHKSNELYGLYHARQQNRKLTQIIIVEGYMDVVALAEQGINHAVATLGTATTPDHLRQLIRTAPDIVFCFDGDRAGREAAWRAAENALPLLGGNYQLRFLFLPDGEDPDSMVRQEGADAFLARVDTALPFSDFFFNTLESRVDCNSLDGRARLIEITKPYLQHVPASSYRDMLEQRLADTAKTNLTQLKSRLTPPLAAQTRAPSPMGQKKNQTLSPLRIAITILLQHPDLASQLEQAGEPLLIATLERPGIAVLIALLESLATSPQLNTAALVERWRDTPSEQHIHHLAYASLSFAGEELLGELIGCLNQLQQQAKQQRHGLLSDKPFNTLTDAEKQELKDFK